MFRKISLLVLLSIVALAGCSGKKSPMSADYEPTRDGAAWQTMGGPQGIVDEATAVKSKPDNPKFLTARNIQLKSAAAKNLDALLRPALKRLFKDVKIISEGEMPKYNEGIIDTYKYVTKARITEQDGVPLHSMLSGEYRFSPSVRLGTKPTVTSKWIAMSFTKSSTGGNYSLALYIDLVAQVIRVESYELGSKYDRLM